MPLSSRNLNHSPQTVPPVRRGRQSANPLQLWPGLFMEFAGLSNQNRESYTLDCESQTLYLRLPTRNPKPHVLSQNPCMKPYEGLGFRVYA